MKRIILTGGTGFIGRNLLESNLMDKYEILAPTRQEMNLCDEQSVAEYLSRNPCDVMIHSALKPANRASHDLSRILAENSRMFFNLIQNLDGIGKIIHLGSGSGYDMRNYKPKLKEELFGESIPLDELGLYKFMVGKFAEFDTRIVDLRIFGIYGKYEDYSIRFISNMICKALFDLPLTMNQDRYFDYIFVEDLPKILEYFIEAKAHFSSYNITPDASILLSDIAKLVLHKIGKSLPIIISKEGLGVEYSGNNLRIKNEIASFSLTSLEEGISNLIAYYRNTMNTIDRQKLLTDK